LRERERERACERERESMIGKYWMRESVRAR